MANDYLNIPKFLRCQLRVLADVGRQESAQSGNQELHTFSPVGLDWTRIKDAFTEGRVIGFHLGWESNESSVELESIANIVTYSLLNYSIKARRQQFFDLSKGLGFMLSKSQTKSRCLEQDVCVVRADLAVFDRFLYEVRKHLA